MTEPVQSAEDFKPKLATKDGLTLSSYTPGPAGLNGSGGGGTFDGMEARVAVLENEVKHIREDIGLIRTDVRKAGDDIGTIKTDLALAKADIKRLPSKEWNVKALSGLAAFITALTVLVNFGPTILRLLKAP